MGQMIALRYAEPELIARKGKKLTPLQMEQLQEENALSTEQMQMGTKQNFSLSEEQKEKLSQSIKEQQSQMGNKISSRVKELEFLQQC